MGRRLIARPMVGAWVGASAGDCQAFEEVGPAARVAFRLGLGVAVVEEPDGGASTLGDKRDLDRARVRRQPVGAGVSPAHDESSRRVELDVVTADGYSVDVERELAAGSRIEGGVVAHPAHDRLRVGEVLVHALGLGLPLVLGNLKRLVEESAR
jgi:hypothetical protein